MEVHSSTVSRWIKEILKKTGVVVDVFKGHSTPSASISKACLSVFQWMIYLVEGHGQMNLPGKNSIISNGFQKNNFFRKEYKSSLLVRHFKQRTRGWTRV